MNTNELEQVIKYQKQSLDYLHKWLREEVEKEKKPDFLQTETEIEAVNSELDWSHNDEMKREELYD